MGEGPLVLNDKPLGAPRWLTAGGLELPRDDTCVSSCSGGSIGCRSTGLVPELSLDVPDGTPLVTASVWSPRAGSVDSAKDGVPELGVIMVLMPGAMSTIPVLGCWFSSNTVSEQYG